MNQKISVIVPVYKAEKYIHRCINSILEQTHENLEIILVNDGSPDKCGEICDSFQLKDPRIIVIHTDNQGSSMARNIGLERATGDYIAFVDSDDWIEKNMYSILLKNMLDFSLEIVECDFWKKGRKNSHSFLKPEVQNIDQILQRLTKPGFFNVWTKLYKKSIIEGLRFRPGKIHQDALYISQVLQRIDKLLYLPVPLVNYNQENESVTRTKYNRAKIGSIELMIEVQNNLTQIASDPRNIELIRIYIMDFLNKHYQSLYENEDLDTEHKIRSKVKKLIRKNYRLGDFNPYYIAAVFFNKKIYKLFHILNKKRIMIKNKKYSIQ